MAVVLGLLLGFAIDRKTEQLKGEKSRKDLMQQIYDELQQIKKKLSGAYPPERLQVPIWDSTVASGQLSLFDMEQLRSLTEVYKFAKEVDWDAQKVRDLYTEYEKLRPGGNYNRVSAGTSLDVSNLKNLLDKYADAHRIRETRLREQIDNLFKVDWWIKDTQRTKNLRMKDTTKKHSFIERLKRSFMILTKTCYYTFTLLGLLFLYFEVLKLQATNPASNPDWYVYLVFIFFVFAAIYATWDMVNQINIKKELTNNSS